MIDYRNVTVRYQGRVEALRDVSLQIPRGDFVFLVGSTGSGKSTLMKLLYRELKPSSGSVWYGDREVSALPNHQVPGLRRTLGVVFQDFQLLTYKSALENVEYALQVVGAEPREIHRKALDALSLVGLADRAGDFPNQLSGGEQQRVSIARALVSQPSALLADEPTGNLDLRTSLEVIEHLDTVNRTLVDGRPTTVVVATHDRDVVNHLGKRVVVLDAGRVLADGHGWYDPLAPARVQADPAPDDDIDDHSDREPQFDAADRESEDWIDTGDEAEPR